VAGEVGGACTGVVEPLVVELGAGAELHPAHRVKAKQIHDPKKITGKRCLILNVLIRTS